MSAQLARTIACRGIAAAFALGAMFLLFTWFWVQSLDLKADLERASVSFLDENIQVLEPPRVECELPPLISPVIVARRMNRRT